MNNVLKKSRLLLILFALVLLTACDDYSQIREDLSKIKTEATLPAPVSTATTLKEAEPYIRIQQDALRDALLENYHKTHYDRFKDKYSSMLKSKLIYFLNSARADLDNDVIKQFQTNMFVVMQNVKDYENISAYISDQQQYVQSFYIDYDNIQKDSSNENLSLMFIRYAQSNNDYAKAYLLENKDEVLKACIDRVAENAKAEEDFREKLGENNQIVECINDLYGSADSNTAQQISNANKTLMYNLLESMDTLSDSEKKKLLEQLGLGKKLTVEIPE